MLNKSKVLTFSDPEIEQWFTAIKEVITNNTKGITKSEMKEATRLTAGLTLMTTSLLPLKPNSNKCEDAMLLKTLVIPVVRFNSSKTFILRDGLLKEESSSSICHTLLSEDSILSKTTTLFRRKIQVIGRSCIISNTVTSSSSTLKQLLGRELQFFFWERNDNHGKLPHRWQNGISQLEVYLRGKYNTTP